MKIKITTKAIEDRRVQLRHLNKALNDTMIGHSEEYRAKRYAELKADRAKVMAAQAQELAAINMLLRSALDAVNGRATRFTICTPVALRDLADEAEKLLAERGVTKKHRVGSVLVARPAGPSANAYKYSAKSTRVTLTRTSSGWWLTGVEETSVNPREKEKFDLTISSDAEADVVRTAMAGLTIRA